MDGATSSHLQITRFLHHQPQSHIALLLIGAAFRSEKQSQQGSGGTVSCNVKHSLPAQEQASKSHIANILGPLEKGNRSRAEVVVAMNRCTRGHTLADTLESENALHRLSKWYGPWLAAAKLVNSTGVGVSWLRAYVVLSLAEDRRGAQYDFVLRMRLDLFVVNSIGEWRGDFSRMLFQEKCSLCHEDDSNRTCASEIDTTDPKEIAQRSREIDHLLVTDASCHIFVDDKFLWTPRVATQVVLRRLRSDFTFQNPETNIDLDLSPRTGGCMHMSPYTHNWALACRNSPHFTYRRDLAISVGVESCHKWQSELPKMDLNCAFFAIGPRYEFRPRRNGA